ncbi:MAG: hypothetical protein MJ231_06950 [bacterium]|nr:hypothetical protein [bacterium]
MSTVKDFVFEKLYDKYVQDLNRRTNIENKILGFATVNGIILASFLLLQTTVLINIEVCKQNVFSMILYFSEIGSNGAYGFFCVLTFIKIFDAYKPKKKYQFDLNGNWKTLQELDEEEGQEAIIEELRNDINKNEEINQKMVNELQDIHFCMICQSVILLISFVLMIILLLRK